MKFVNLLRTREKNNVELVFNALKDWKYTRYQQSGKLEDHEKMRAIFVLRRWRAMVVRRAGNLKKFDVLSIKTDDNQVLRFLRAWRTQLYMKQMEENLAVPFFEESVMVNQRRNVLYALKDNVAY